MNEPVIAITPSQGWTSLKLGEFWDNRELLHFLVWRVPPALRLDTRSCAGQISAESG